MIRQSQDIHSVKFIHVCWFSGDLMLHMFRTRLLYNPSISLMYSELVLGSLKASWVGYFEAIFGSFTCYLLSQGVIILHATGFCNLLQIIIHKKYLSKLVVLRYILHYQNYYYYYYYYHYC